MKENNGKSRFKGYSLFSGIAVAAFLWFFNPFQVDPYAGKVLAIAGLMVTWWVTEAMPMPVVALIPIILFPLLNISSLSETVRPYSNEVIFLFMGGFMLGLAIEKWNLHKRIALNIVRLTGTSGNRIVLGFILATGLISMWLSNTATTMMMFPIALSVIHVMKENNVGQGNMANFSLTLMLAIAYASNIGGISTIIGTPPNAAYVNYIETKYGTSVDFLDWMLLCMPLAILLLIALYLVMVKLMYPNHIKSDQATRSMIHDEIAQLGPMSVNEKRAMWIFLGTAFLWITKGFINKAQTVIQLDDNIIAIIGAVSLFICPAKSDTSDTILEWSDTKNMAWGILLLFGGGIGLATALEKAGLIQQLGEWLSQFSHNGFVLMVAITIISLFISELMSNIAQVIVFAPVVSSLADAIGINPLLLGIPMTLAASCASMFPMGTPPNAIVFASGYIRLKQMARTGFVINIVAVILIVLFCWWVLPFLMG